MSILKTTYQLGKKFAESSENLGLKNLLENLHLSEQKNFGYHSNHSAKQFLGYLLFNKELQNGSPYNAVTSVLTKKDYNLLYTFHKQICEINKNCIAGFVALYPIFSDFLSIYKENIVNEDNLLSSVSLTTTEEAHELINAFSQHPAFLIAKNEIEKNYAGENIEDSIKKALRLEANIWRAGPIGDFFGHYIREILNRKLTNEIPKYLIALLCVRDSLFNLNQLLFQETVSSKPAMLSRKNIIDAGFKSGDDLTLTVQFTNPTIEEIFVRSHISLCLLKDVTYHQSDSPQLVRVERSSHEYIMEAGTIYQLEMREIDESLNSFKSLLHFAEHFTER